MKKPIGVALWRSGRLLCAGAMILTLASGVGATTLTPRSMAELVAESDTIVVGLARAARAGPVRRARAAGARKNLFVVLALSKDSADPGFPPFSRYGVMGEYRNARQSCAGNFLLLGRRRQELV